jgi:hypothetical protein
MLKKYFLMSAEIGAAPESVVIQRSKPKACLIRENISLLASMYENVLLSVL